MSNVVFELFAKLGLDSSEYEKGLDKSKSLAGSVGGAIGNGLKTMAKVGVAAIGTATAAVGAFATSSVKTGAEFDKSMSQVAATMGKTMDEMQSEVGSVDLAWGTFSGNLREYAQEMGRNTAFSATQAADALNYMALAGYDTQTSMEMLPNVLNLAAAGSMDLARASDMVTDTQTAFGISLERTSQMVDEMAKAASTGNTSVEQLGDAFLVVGGLAQEMNGGMVQLSDGTTATYDNVQELEIALTAMANAGIKGSEAGTHMRNMLLKLASPTEDGYKAFTQLGVSVFDSEGKMRSLAGIMEDLDGAMANLTQEEKLQAISDIFNTRDTAAAEALLNAVGDDWGKIAESILDADGAAQKMAATQLDNLAGDVTLFQSALEGAKIAVSDQLTPSLRQFVQFGTDGLSRLTSAFQRGGINEVMNTFGHILTEGIRMITAKLPDAVNAGMELLGAVGRGIMLNLPSLINAAKQIIPIIGQGILQALPALLDGAIQIISQLGAFLIESIPTLIPAIVNLVNQMVLMLVENAPALVDGAVALLTGLSTALIENLPTLIPAILQLVVSIVTALIENLPVLVQAVIDINVALVQAIIENLPLFIDACVQILVAIVNLLVQYGTQFLTEVSNALSNIWNKAVEFGKQVVDFIVNSFKDFLDRTNTGMRDMFNKVVEWLAQLPGKMAYYAGYAIGEFIKFVIQLPGKIQEIFTNVMSKVTSFGTNFVNKAKEAAKNFLDSMVNGIKDLPSNLASIFSSVISAVSSFASDMISKATEAASGFVSNLVDGVSSLPDKFAEIGSNIVQGIWNGISDGWQWLKDSVADLANSLLQGAKDALGIESPSKEFAYVGRMVDEGFAKGINDYSHLIDGALDDIISLPSIDNLVGDLSSNVSVANGVNATGNNGYTQILNITSPTALSPYEVARQARNATRDMVLAMSM